MPDDVSATYDFGEDAFAPQGAVRLSKEAETGARQFLNSLTKFDSSAAWVAAFEWCYGRTMRRTPEAAVVDEGPGIDLAGYKTSELPSSAVELRDGLRVAFILPREKIDRAAHKEIVQIRLPSGRISYALE